MRIDAFDFALNQGDHFRGSREAAKVGVGHLVFQGVTGHMFLVDHDQASEVFAAIANHHGIGDVRAELEQAFNVAGGDIFAARSDQNVLDAVVNRQVTLGVDFAAVAGVQPALIVQRFAGLIGHVPVTAEHVGATHQNLVVFANSKLGARGFDARPAQTNGTFGGGGTKACGFRHAKGFAQLDAAAQKPADQIRGDGCGTGECTFDVWQPQKNTYVAKGQPLHDFEQKAGWAGGLSLQLGFDPGSAHGACGAVNPAGRGDGIAHEQVDLRIHFFPKAGRCKHQMRSHLPQVVEYCARIFRKVDHQPQSQGVVDRGHALSDMAKRQKRDGFVARLDVQVFAGQAQLKDQVAVQCHGPFGCTGGP